MDFFRKHMRCLNGGVGCSPLDVLLQERQLPVTVGETSRPRDEVSLEKKSQWDVILNNGSVETYAPLNVEKLKKDEKRPQLIIRPYFGSFAGHKVTFDLKKTDTIKVKIEGCTHRLTLYHRNDSKLLGVRDRCLRFAHDSGSHQLVNMRNSGSSPQQPPFRKKPLSLKFLCEQTMLVHLHKLPVEGLPARYQHVLTSSAYQDITIHVRPNLCCPTPTLLMRVKKNLSVSELEWMICHRLALQDPSPMKIYYRSFLSPLDSESTLQPSYTHLECVLEPLALQLPVVPAPHGSPLRRQVLVSVVGQGMREVEVAEDWSYGRFEGVLRELFALQTDSFLYIPSLMRSHKSIRMLVPLVRPELVGQKMPVQGPEMESFRSQSLASLGVFGQGLVGIFEVNSPTIPVYVRSFVCMDNLSPGDNFAIVAVKQYLVSVNSSWSTDIFFKYIESISGFPCEGLCVGKNRIQGPISVLLERNWVKSKHGCLELRRDIPRILYG